MKVAITGSQGYLGTILTPLLKHSQCDLHAVDSDLYRKCGIEPVENIYLPKDVRQIDTSDIQGCVALIHLAGLSNDPLGNINPSLTMEINHSASVRLAELSKTCGVKKFIFLSTCSVYGAASAQLCDETTTPNPITPYAQSKLKVEEELSAMADDSFCPVFLRCATAYGMSPRIRFDLVVNDLVARALATGKIGLKSDGSAWRPFIHVEDIARAVVTVLKAPLEIVSNEAFNLSTTNLKIIDLATLISDSIEGTTVKIMDAATVDQRSYQVSAKKFLKAFPNFNYRWSLETGILDTVKRLKKYNFTEDEIDGPKYSRVLHLKSLMAQGEVDAKLYRNSLEN